MQMHCAPYTKRIRRIARLIGIRQASGGAIHPGNITVVFSSNPRDRGTEQDFLSMNRLGILAEFEEKFGGVYVYEGEVFLIRRRKGHLRKGRSKAPSSRWATASPPD
jgi:hypothetical protein